MNGTKILVRTRQGRMIAGVCAGVADYFGVDVTLVRVLDAPGPRSCRLIDTSRCGLG